MDIGIRVKLKEYENMYESLKITCTKKQVKQMQKLLKDVIYYIKKDYDLANPNELISKYENMYFEIKQKI